MDGRDISAAWRTFRDDPANASLFDGQASGIYLANRLERAFIAGIGVAEGSVNATPERH